MTRRARSRPTRSPPRRETDGPVARALAPLPPSPPRPRSRSRPPTVQPYELGQAGAEKHHIFGLKVVCESSAAGCARTASGVRERDGVMSHSTCVRVSRHLKEYGVCVSTKITAPVPPSPTARARRRSPVRMPVRVRPVAPWPGGRRAASPPPAPHAACSGKWSSLSRCSTTSTTNTFSARRVPRVYAFQPLRLLHRNMLQPLRAPARACPVCTMV